MTHRLERYLEHLLRYADRAYVPGLDVVSEPIPLQEIFIEPRLEMQMKRKQAARSDRSSLGETVAPETGREATAESAIAVLSREHRLVVLGEPGQGKTTLLRQYAAILAAVAEKPSWPLLVELGKKPERSEKIAEKFAWLEERIPDALRSQLGTDAWKAFVERLESSSICVLLDGYDELSDRRAQASEGTHRYLGQQSRLAYFPSRCLP